MPNSAPSALRFTNALCIHCAFEIPTTTARQLLPPQTRLNIVEIFPGQALLVIAFALYRESSFGAHAEASLALVATPAKTQPLLTITQLLGESRYPGYVLHMFVNNQEAQRIGVERWGLPRLLADVRIAAAAGQTVGEVFFEGQRVVQVKAEQPQLGRSRKMAIESYTQNDGDLQRAIMQCEAGTYGKTQGGGAKLLWGDHAIGQRLSGLKVAKCPMMVRYYERMQAELHPPQPI